MEEQLDAPSQWNEVPELMMDSGTEEGMPEATIKRKEEEVARDRRKLWREDNIRADKREDSEDWGEDQQDKDDWEVPDKGQRISPMVFSS